MAYVKVVNYFIDDILICEIGVVKLETISALVNYFIDDILICESGKSWRGTFLHMRCGFLMVQEGGC